MASLSKGVLNFIKKTLNIKDLNLIVKMSTSLLNLALLEIYQKREEKILV